MSSPAPPTFCVLTVTAEVDALQRVEALEAEIRELKAKLAQN